MIKRKYIIRSSTVFLFLIVSLLIFSVKLVFIQVFNSEHLSALAEKQHKHLIELEPVRGAIYDRNERPLAFNVPVYSLFANPKVMTDEDKQAAVAKLSLLLKMDPEFIQKRLGRDKYFVWIKRKLDKDISDKIAGMDIPGLDFRRESKRYYPNKELAAHVIGFSGVDNKGLEGIELYYDEYLKGKAGWVRLFRDAQQRELMIGNNLVSPEDGSNIVLTIDETIQFIAEKALKKAFDKHNAIAATIIVIDTRTGEILALANRPTYDLDNVAESSKESRTNRAVSYVYEPGSVFKIVVASAALEEEFFTEEDVIFCENGKYRVANHILHDHKPYGKLSFRDVFGKSSNIGVTKIAQKLGPKIVYDYAKRFRFGIKTGIDLRGEVNGVLKHPRAWSKTTIGAIPIGHEVLVTPVQLASAIAAVANDGVYMRPFVVKYIRNSLNEIVKEFLPKRVDRIISVDTARRVNAILQGVVENGTGGRAKIRGVKVAGKTGTAQKVIDGKYSHSKFYATFIGFAPADNPRIAAVVVFDEPHPSHYGGTVAAPVFKTVVENTLKYLGDL